MENFSVRWTGTILPPATGTYTFYVDGDNRVKVFVNAKLLLNKKTPGRREISKKITLTGNQPAAVKIEYVHVGGASSLHVAWSGPDFGREILTPVKGAHAP
jgi:beta-glucosidase